MLTPPSRARSRLVIAAACAAVLLASTGSLAAAAASSTPTAGSSTTISSTTTLPGTEPAPAIAAALTTKPSLSTGEKINIGQGVVSPNGSYLLYLESTGDLALYKNGARSLANLVWRSATPGLGITQLRMQANGNLVMLDALGVKKWGTGTNPSAGDSLIVSNSGHILVESGGNLPLWDTGALTHISPTTMQSLQSLSPGQGLVSGDGRFHAWFTPKGNLALLGPAGEIWNAGVAGKGGVALVLKGNGNLVIARADGSSLWWSGTRGLLAQHLVMQSDGNLVLYAPSGAVWSNGSLIALPYRSVGVYAYPSPSQALSDGWPFIGVTGALGTCGAPYTGQGFYPHNGNDEQTGFAIQNAGRAGTPWLSFWTVSGPTVMTSAGCSPTTDQSPQAFYNVGYAAGQFVAHRIDHYAADGLSLKPTDIILDPEGYPDYHSGLDNGIGSPNSYQIARWTQMLLGWQRGLDAADPSLQAGVYADQAEYTGYQLASSPLPAFIAVAFGNASSTTLIDPVRLPGVNGGNIKGFIAFFALSAPVSPTIECDNRLHAQQLLASWGAPENTLQFDPGVSCHA